MYRLSTHLYKYRLRMLLLVAYHLTGIVLIPLLLKIVVSGARLIHLSIILNVGILHVPQYQQIVVIGMMHIIGVTTPIMDI